MAKSNLGETINTFLSMVDQAKVMGEEWVETTPDIIAFYNRRGLNGKSYFWFNGVRVCEAGQKEAIEKSENEQMDRIKHGMGEGIVLGRT